MMRPFVQVASLIDPADPYAPWEPLFNVEICPAEFLPWLAQVVGVRLPDGLTEEQARSFIKDLSFEEIGTPRALMAAVRSVLVPSNPPAPATVWFRERDGGDAYYIEIVTLIDETPDPAALDRVIASQLPAAIVISSREVEAWDYEQMTTEGGTYGDQKAAYTTYLKLREHEPA
jgi:P2-related tail formation protein